MSELYVDATISDCITKIQEILNDFGTLQSKTRSLSYNLGSASWKGQAFDKCTGMLEFSEHYLDDIKFLYEALNRHITELEEDAGDFSSTASCMKYLRR
jgi:hypothetical protein